MDLTQIKSTFSLSICFISLRYNCVKILKLGTRGGWSGFWDGSRDKIIPDITSRIFLSLEEKNIPSVPVKGIFASKVTQNQK